jgi:hypothetical protein
MAAGSAQNDAARNAGCVLKQRQRCGGKQHKTLKSRKIGIRRRKNRQEIRFQSRNS